MAWSIPFLSRATAEASSPATPALSEEQALLNGRRAEALDLARQTAEAEGRQPTITDYVQAAMAMPELQQNPRVIADLSGQRLDGFLIRQEDIQPQPEQGVRNLRNFYDLDGNGAVEAEAISGFYRELQSNLKFTGTQFHNVTFQPATTLQIMDHAAGASYANITLDGLGRDEVLTIGTASATPGIARETFNNVHLINDQGGTIRVAGNATLNGLTVEGGNTVLEIASGGQVNQLNVRGETVSLAMQPNSRMFLPSFENVSFTPDSTMRGASLQGNPMDDRFHGFRNSDLNGMNFEGATLSGITFDNVNLSGASFRGARRLADCVIRDTDIAAIDFSGASIHNLTIERGGQTIRIDSLDQLQQFQRQEASINAAMNIGRGMNLDFSNPAPSAPVEQSPALAASSVAATTDAPEQSLASLGKALTENFGQGAVCATQNDVCVQKHSSQEAREAMAAVLEAKAQAAMEGYSRGDGRTP